MGSISFRQGQKALACRLAHCVALTNDVAWKKTQSGIIVPMMQHHCQTNIGYIFKLVMMKTRPWWWDQVGTLQHTTPHSAAPLLCPKIPGNRSGSGQRREIERVRRLFCTCYFDLWGFWTEYMYQLVSFFSRNMYVLCFLLSDKHFENYLLAPKMETRTTSNELR